MSMLSCDIICECYMRVTQRFASVNESPCTRPSELPACSSSRNFIFVTCVCSTSRYTHDNKLSAEPAWAADHTWQVDGRMLSSVTVYYVYIDSQTHLCLSEIHGDHSLMYSQELQGTDQNGPSPKRPQWRSKTAHANQNGPNGRKNKTKTAPANIQNGPFSCPKRPIT